VNVDVDVDADMEMLTTDYLNRGNMDITGSIGI